MLVSSLIASLVVASGASPGGARRIPVRPPSKLQSRILDAMACASPANGGGLLGVHAVNVQTGRVIHSFNGQNSFIPASNAKLFSTALALVRLGPDYRFTTRLAADREPDERGVVEGDLFFVGGGDPTLGSSIFSQVNGKPASPDVIADFASALVAKGVRHIKGGVIGDETLYPSDPYPVGWTIDDSTFDFGAAVSALTIHDNVQMISASPWAVRFTPAVEYFTVFNRIRVGEESNVRVERVGGRQIVLAGFLPADRISVEAVSVDQPALYAATLLHEALTRRGVQIDNAPGIRSRRAGDPLPPAPKAVLFERKSPPLIEILRVVDKVSHNLYAELVLREVGRVASGEATREAGLREIYSLLGRSGASSACCYFQDGSGLSRQTLVTPEAATRVLSYIYRSDRRTDWLSLLPIGAVDGTLTQRFEGAEETAQRIRAKTGSLAHVTALSGYVFSKTYGELAFSILYNNFNGDPADARAVVDKIALALAE